MSPLTVARSLSAMFLLCGCEPSAPASTVEPPISSTGNASKARPAGSEPSSTASSSASSVPTISAAVAPPPIPTLYGELFQEGAKITLTVKTRVWAQGKTKHGALRASCEVTLAGPAFAGMRSHVTCTGMPDVDMPDPLSGVWTFTAAGLFHHYPSAEEPLTLDEAHLVFVPGPQPTVKRLGESEDESSVLKIEKQGNAWCSTHDFRGGDPAWTAICLEEGVGVRSGKWGWTGGTTHEAELERMPSR